MSIEEEDILSKQIKGVTVKILWRAFYGWTTLVILFMGIYFSLKSSITTGFSQQNTVDKIQDIRIEQIKHDVDLQGQKIEQMDQMYNNNYSKNK